ncbi:DegT/DnrJ/EryC1/StrS family aminotransferase [Glaciecola sp. XM2]|uniref:DegT/DnrJ/EryC1/StrS family aminotransferase n=1 Tax=Glaciecola sp. XM2 TaxID=1914931 RepID=UPI001BDECC37|nr:DegT/DnrJ/EryC1/StrS family aminotransferase [Glaciecola sp. XM2]MBT1450663.1 DegT/DnrJ/EryC1/StrS family aminotransferase [Glaciecola sp. XM2]
MDTVETITMGLSALAPTGNRVRFTPSNKQLESFFKGYTVTPCASGTAALALAIEQARLERNVTQPEVLLPAYGCPDLIAAAEFAQVKPILIDVQPSTPWMNLDLVASAINDNTVAIVAVTFLGIRERIALLQEHIGKRNIALIEDSAQWCPSQTTETYNTEIAILSFGRGKPVSMMGGGLLLSKNKLHPSPSIDELKAQPSASALEALKYKLKARVFNTILQPLVYGLVSRLPFLSIGETQYKALDDIEPMQATAKSLLSANIQHYQTKYDRSEQLRTIMANPNLKAAGIVDLGSQCGLSGKAKQLRFPILFPNTQLRDDCLQAMAASGLGASAMYGKALYQIDQVEPKAALHTSDAMAQDFASRVLTLPTHEFVNDTHLKKIEQVLTGLANSIQ